LKIVAKAAPKILVKLTKRSEKIGESSENVQNEGCDDLKKEDPKIDESEEDLELGEIDEKSETIDRTEIKEMLEDPSVIHKTTEPKPELTTGI